MTVNEEKIETDLSLPLVIGVTGHRDIHDEDIPHLKNCVRKIFDDLHRKYPASSLLVMSPLAEGADRLVAQVALETHPDGNPRALLFVPLPMPIPLYEKDCERAKSKEEFRYLMGQSTRHFELPLVEHNTLASISEYGSARDRQYAQVGAYIARHSHILIALWDGEQSNKEGGTSQVVGFKLRGIRLPYAPPQGPLDLVDNGPVYHIHTRRQTTAHADNSYALDIKFPEEYESSQPNEITYDRILQQMNTFNSDAKRIIPQRREEVHRNKGFVILESQCSGLSFEARFILNKYAIADTLALYFQRWTRWALILLFVLAVTAVLSFEVYAHLLNYPIVLSLYPIALGAALIVYWLAKYCDVKNKHLNYRALAEGLRVQLFWMLAGLSDEVADHYLRQHRTELDWIRNAIRAWNALAGRLTPRLARLDQSSSEGLPLQVTEARFDLVFHNWVDDQWKFFSDAAYRDREKLSSRLGAVKALFLLGLSAAILLIALHALSVVSEHALSWHLLVVLMGIMPAIAAAVGGYAEKMALSAQSKRYEWMSSLFSRAARQLRILLLKEQYPAARQLVFDLGREALEENGDWVMVHRERTADVYKPA